MATTPPNPSKHVLQERRDSCTQTDAITSARIDDHEVRVQIDSDSDNRLTLRDRQPQRPEKMSMRPIPLRHPGPTSPEPDATAARNA
jgi:hypothetical protein